MRSGGAARRPISRPALTRPRKPRPRKKRPSALAECNAKFAGRRKPGGGYTYYDFMQDRTFDIAGPNPTPEEQKKIDEQYTAYLERERRNSIAAALMAKQQQQQQVQQVSLRSDQEAARTESAKVPVPVESPVKQAARIRAANCARSSFSCDWPRLSETVNDLKKLFSSTPSKQKKSLRAVIPVIPGHRRSAEPKWQLRIAGYSNFRFDTGRTASRA